METRLFSGEEGMADSLLGVLFCTVLRNYFSNLYYSITLRKYLKTKHIISIIGLRKLQFSLSFHERRCGVVRNVLGLLSGYQVDGLERRTVKSGGS